MEPTEKINDTKGTSARKVQNQEASESKQTSLVGRVIKSRRNNCKYTVIEKLGEGTQSTVFKASRRMSSKYQEEFYAIKCTERSYFATNNDSKNKGRRKCLERERQVMEKLDSPHVIKYLEFLSSTNRIYMVVEFSNGGNL